MMRSAMVLTVLLAKSAAGCASGENSYTHIEQGQCAETCLGDKLGICPISIVISTGNLTEGTCAAAGYNKDTSTTKDVKAGPCGTIHFEVYDKSPAVKSAVGCASGENSYTHIEQGQCAETCLGDKLGICPISIVVSTGNLTEGTCAAAGYNKDTSTTKDVKAGPCGTIHFEVYDKSPSVKSAVGCASGEDSYTHIEQGQCAETCLGDKLGICPISIVISTGNLTAGTCSAAGYNKDTSTTKDVKAGPCGTIHFEVYNKTA